MTNVENSLAVDKRYMVLMTKFHFMDTPWGIRTHRAAFAEPYSVEKQISALGSFLGATFYDELEGLLPIVQTHQKFRDDWKSFIFDLIADTDREHSDEKIFLLALDGISAEDTELLKGLPTNWVYRVLSGTAIQEFKLQAETVDML